LCGRKSCADAAEIQGEDRVRWEVYGGSYRWILSKNSTVRKKRGLKRGKRGGAIKVRRITKGGLLPLSMPATNGYWRQLQNNIAEFLCSLGGRRRGSLAENRGFD